MHLLNNASGTAAQGETAPAIAVAGRAHTSGPWDIATAPWHQWSLLADAALERGDEQAAAEMIRFAYWSADSGS